MKKLSNDRLESFNTDYVHSHVGWDRMGKIIESNFPVGNFTFLDVGGGSGVFADSLLEMFPKAHGTVMDNAGYLLNINRRHERKTLIECSVESMSDHFNGIKFDLIIFNWVLHHFVENTYNGTLNSISNALISAKQLLSKEGVILILENCYIPYYNELLPSKIIYYALSSSFLSHVTKLLGANTSGTGVCYLSKNIWCSMLNDVGMKVIKCERTRSLNTKLFERLFCLIKGIDVVYLVSR